MNPVLKGSVKSKTNWLGLFVIMLGYAQGNLGDFKVILAPLMKPELVQATVGMLNMALGLAIIVTRYFTTESLAEKGGA